MTLTNKKLLIGIDGNEANVESRVGVNQFAHGLLWALSKSDSPHDFLIYLSTSPSSDLPKEAPNWHYRVIGPPKLWTQWRLPLDLFTSSPKPDVFFSPSHYSPRYSPIPTVVSIMDLGFLDTPGQFTKRDYYQLKNWTGYSLKNAKHVVTITEFSKKDIIRKYNIDKNLITVIYPGYDSNVFRKYPQSEVKNRLAGYHLQPPYILFLGSLKPSKNVERLVQSFASLTKNKKVSPDLKLIIAGKKAWLYEQIFAQVKKFQLENRVVFTGYFPEEDKPYLISGAEVFVLPSFFEGFGIPAVEAIACHVPVVVSRVACLPEVVGPAGFYIDPQNSQSIEKGLAQALFLSKSQKEEITNNALNYIKMFSWDSAAKKTISVLENVVF